MNTPQHKYCPPQVASGWHAGLIVMSTFASIIPLGCLDAAHPNENSARYSASRVLRTELRERPDRPKGYLVETYWTRQDTPVLAVVMLYEYPEEKSRRLRSESHDGLTTQVEYDLNGEMVSFDISAHSSMDSGNGIPVLFLDSSRTEYIQVSADTIRILQDVAAASDGHALYRLVQVLRERYPAKVPHVAAR